MTTTPIRVYLVDDHPVVRDGYRRLLENNADIEIVGEAGSGEAACEHYVNLQPDVVVLDLNMPGIGGIETISRLRAKHKDVNILVFSMHDSPIMVRRALEAGASGFLTKSCAAVQMVDAVQAVANGKPFLNDTVAPSMLDIMQNTDHDPLKALSKREFEVFCRLADGQPVVDIAKALSISPKTAGVHQTNIMRKLDLRNAAELTRLAIRCGVIEA